MKVIIAIITTILLAGCSDKNNTELPMQFLECVVSPKLHSTQQCEPFFTENLLVKADDRVYLKGHRTMTSLDFYSAGKTDLEIAWRQFCKEGCDGHNNFNDWWDDL